MPPTICFRLNDHISGQATSPTAPKASTYITIMTRRQGSPSGKLKDKSHSLSARLSSYSGGQHLSHALRLSSTSLSSKLSRNSTCLPRLLGEVRPQLTCPGTLRMPGGGFRGQRGGRCGTGGEGGGLGGAMLENLGGGEGEREGVSGEGGRSTTRRTRDGVARRVGGKGGGVGEAGLR